MDMHQEDGPGSKRMEGVCEWPIPGPQVRKAMMMMLRAYIVKCVDKFANNICKSGIPVNVAMTLWKFK